MPETPSFSTIGGAISITLIYINVSLIVLLHTWAVASAIHFPCCTRHIEVDGQACIRSSAGEAEFRQKVLSEIVGATLTHVIVLS
jgi:hypothetical protein